MTNSGSILPVGKCRSLPWRMKEVAPYRSATMKHRVSRLRTRAPAPKPNEGTKEKGRKEGRAETRVPSIFYFLQGSCLETRDKGRCHGDATNPRALSLGVARRDLWRAEDGRAGLRNSRLESSSAFSALSFEALRVARYSEFSTSGNRVP